MATKKQRHAKHVRRVHHNAFNRTAVPHECVARSKRMGVSDFEAMNVTTLRKLAAENGLSGLSKASKPEVISALSKIVVRKESVNASSR